MRVKLKKEVTTVRLDMSATEANTLIRALVHLRTLLDNYPVEAYRDELLIATHIPNAIRIAYDEQKKT